jgi:hypothetical protein
MSPVVIGIIAIIILAIFKGKDIVQLVKEISEKIKNG